MSHALSRFAALALRGLACLLLVVGLLGAADSQPTFTTQSKDLTVYVGVDTTIISVVQNLPGGTTSVAFKVDGTLPAWLKLLGSITDPTVTNANLSDAGVFTGKPGTGDVGNVSLTIHVALGPYASGMSWDTVSNQTMTLNLHVVDGAMTPTPDVPLPYAVVNKAYTYQLTSTGTNQGGTVSYAVSGLPSTLSCSTTGKITGTPTATAVSIPLTVTVNNSTPNGPVISRSATTSLTILAVEPPVVTVPALTAWTGEAFSYQVSSTGTPSSYAMSGSVPGLSFNPATGGLSGTPTTVGSTTLGFSATNAGGTSATSSAVLTVNPGTPALNLPASRTAIHGQAFSFQVSGTNSPTSYSLVSLTPSGSGLTLDTLTGVLSASPIVGSPTQTVTYTATLGASNGFRSSTGVLTITVNPPAVPVITPNPDSRTLTVGQSFTYTITASGNPSSFAVTQAAGGPSLDTQTGILTWTPTLADVGTRALTLTATNVGGTSASATLNLTVSAPAVPAVTAATFTGTIGVPFSAQVSASNSPTAYTMVGLPPAGLSFNQTTGVISGTPSGPAGTTTCSVSASNAGGTGSASQVSITISQAVPAAPVITSALTATGTVGVPFTYTLTASGNSVTYGADLTAVPSLVFSGATISGTPAAAGTFNIPITAQNSGGTAAKTLVLTVAPAPSAVPVITPSQAWTGTVGVAFSQQISASNSPGQWSAAPLPGGVGLNAASGVISGLPTTAGVTTVTLGASNGAGSATPVTATITISAAAAPTISAQAKTSYVGQALSYQVVASGSPTYAASGLPGVYTLNPQTGVITGTPSAADKGTYPVTVTVTNGGGSASATLTLTVADALPTVAFASNAFTASLGSAFSTVLTVTPASASVVVGGLPSTLSYDDNTRTISGTPAAAGSYTLNATPTLAGVGGAAVTATLTVSTPVTPTVPVITSATAVTATVGTPFSYQITALNNPSAYAVSANPVQAWLDTSATGLTGAIGGTPTAAGSFTMTVTATNGVGASQPQNVTVVVSPAANAPAVPVITSVLTSSGQVGQPYSYTITASNSPTSYTVVSGLPAGLVRNGAVISGQPTAAGTSSVVLHASNGAGVGPDATLVLTVTAAPKPTVTAAGITATVGVPFTYAVQASQNPTGYAMGAAPAAIPGLTIDPLTGVLSGTPTAAGTVTVTVTASNAAGSGSGVVTITIGNPAPVLSGLPATVTATHNTAFSYQISASNTPTGYTASISPAGSALGVNASTGLISGVVQGSPTQAVTYTVLITASNAGGTSTQGTLTIVVNPPAVVVNAVPVITNVPTTQNGTVGSPLTFTVAATNAPTSYSATRTSAGTLGQDIGFDTLRGTLTWTPPASGTVTLSMTATNGSGTSSAVILTIVVAAPAAPTFTPSTATLTGTVNTPFTPYQLQVTAGATLSVIAALPQGLGMDANGLITGTPSVAGSSTATVRATNAGGSSDATLSFTIASANQPTKPAITSVLTATGIVGQPFNYTITANGSGITYGADLSALSGLVLDNATGAITGVPGSTAASIPVTITASNGGGTDSKTLVVTITAAQVPVLAQPSAWTATVGSPFSKQVTASNAPTSYSVTPSSLPSGLSFNTSTGVMSGTPSAAGGPYTLTFGASNAAGAATTVSTTLTIAAASKPVVTVNPLTVQATVNSTFTYQIVANGTPSLTYAASGQPSGISCNAATGVLTGQPTATGSFTTTLTASNGAGTSDPKTVTIVVSAASAPRTFVGLPMPSGTVNTAYSYQVSTQPTGTVFAATGLPSGLGISASGLISGLPTVAGSSTVTLTVDGVASAPQTVVISDPSGQRPTVTAGTLNGTQGTAITAYQIVASKSPTSYRIAGTVPSGLTCAPSTGIISGTPTVSGDYTVTMYAANAAGEGSAVLRIHLDPDATPSPTVTSASATGVVGQAFSYAVVASGSPTAYDASPLPAGLRCDPSTGVISGTPTAAVNATAVTLSARNANGTGTGTLALTITGSGQPSVSGGNASGTVGQAFSYQITASNAPTAYDASPLPSGLSCDPLSGLISGTPTAAVASFAVTLTATNGSGRGSATLNLTITDAQAKAPTVTSDSLIVTAGVPFTYQIAASGTVTSYGATPLPSGVAVSATSGLISGTIAATGDWQLRITAANGSASGEGILTIHANGSGPALTDDVVRGTVGKDLSYAITASGSPTAFTASGLPEGISCSSTSGAFSGIPRAAGTYNVVVTATSAAGSGTGQYTVIIAANDAAPRIISALSADGTVAEAFSYTIAATTGTVNALAARLVLPVSFTYGSGTLPAGLTCDAATGVISGIPTVAGTTVVTIRATNAAGSDAVPLTIRIAPGAVPVITSAATASAVIGTPFSYQITASHNPTAFDASDLPTGLSYSATSGLISGTPLATGSSTITVGATNVVGRGSATVALLVTTEAEAPPVISSPGYANGVVGVVFSYRIEASHNPTSYAASPLPAGLSVDTSTGYIVGVPSAQGTTVAVVKVRNASGSAQQDVTIVIKPAPTDSGGGCGLGGGAALALGGSLLALRRRFSRG